MTTDPKAGSDWLHAFLPLGHTRDDAWQPRGAGVLVLDRPFIWLITARDVIASSGGEDITTWVPGEHGRGLLNLTDGQRQTGVDWVHHPAGLSATMFPIDPRFRIKAFTETQCTSVRDLQPLQPLASVGCLYGPDIEPAPSPTPAVLDGAVAAADARSGTIYSTAPLLPRNPGAPLLLTAPYGGTVTLAGILLGNAIVPEVDPRMLPVRLGRAICIDAALELIRGKEATEQRRRIQESQTDAPPPQPAAEEDPR